MSLKGMLIRFFLVYTVLVILLSVIIPKAHIVVLAGCTFWVCATFGKKNGRYFSEREKTIVVLSLIAIDLALQGIFGFIAISQKISQLDAVAQIAGLVFTFGLIGLIDGIIIYFIVGLVKKRLVKQGVISIADPTADVKSEFSLTRELSWTQNCWAFGFLFLILFSVFAWAVVQVFINKP